MTRLRDYAHWLLLLMVAGYMGLYFGRSKLHRGQFHGVRITIRVFEDRFALRVWAPLLKMEQMLQKEEFYGQIASGASLPPPAPN
jgi:hypothetical protein